MTAQVTESAVLGAILLNIYKEQQETNRLLAELIRQFDDGFQLEAAPLPEVIPDNVIVLPKRGGDDDPKVA